MSSLPSFAHLLPETDDPAKQPIRDRLVQVLDSEGEILPSANSPRGKLWHLVNSPGSSLEECGEIIQLDSALASRILRVANSAAYGAPSENVTAAVLRLGLKFVREQVFNAGVFKQYSGWTLPPEWDLFWLRNIFIARLCDRMCSLHGPTSGSEYLAGLIHDMGWLFLATYCPDEYVQIFASGRPVAQAEADVMPVNHAEIAASLAVRAMLPARAIEAIEFHHYPFAFPDGTRTAAGENENLVAVVLYVCDQLADLCHMDMFGPSTQTTESLYASPEVRWLEKHGKKYDLVELATEELEKSKEIFEIYFSNRKFN
jgi:HD-like signal output (HDOD) protein